MRTWGRFTGMSHQHAASDLGVYLSWCVTRGLDPLMNRCPHLELYVRWLQETRRYKPSTVSRRGSALTGFYRTAVIDEVLESSPAEHRRRPRVPPESPTLGLTHLQFEALLTAARTSGNPFHFARVVMLGLLGLRIFEACSLNMADLREEHGQRVLRVVGKGTKVVLVPLPPAIGRVVDRAFAERDRRADPAQHSRAAAWTGMPRPGSYSTCCGRRRALTTDAPAHAPTHPRYQLRRSRPARRADRCPPRPRYLLLGPDEGLQAAGRGMTRCPCRS